MVVAWGDNAYGESTVPPDLCGVVAIAAGEHFTMALQGPVARLENPARLAGGGFGFNLTETYSRAVTVECSENLKDWVPWTNFVGSNVLIQLQDGTESSAGRRFYRAWTR